MPEPRMMKMPSGGLLNVDVTMLQLGISKMRTIAENAELRLRACSPGEVLQVATEAFDAIAAECRETLHGIEGEQMIDDIAVAIRMKEM